MGGDGKAKRHELWRSNFNVSCVLLPTARVKEEWIGAGNGLRFEGQSKEGRFHHRNLGLVIGRHS